MNTAVRITTFDIFCGSKIK